jgi:malonate transporter
MIHVILLALTPIFFVLGLGFVAGRQGAVDNQNVKSLNALVMEFALPASLFAATASAPRSELVAQGPLFFVLSVVMLVAYAAWYVLQRRGFGATPAEASLQALTVAFPNLAGVGLPLAAALLGPTQTVPIAVAVAAGSILVSPITLLVMELSKSDGGDRRGLGQKIAGAVWRALTKPVVLGPALGIAFCLSGLTLGPVAHASLLLIGQVAAGGALFLTGLVLSHQSFEVDWKVVGATILADLLRPALAFGLVTALALPRPTAGLAILLAAVPSGFFGILFGQTYGKPSIASGSMVIASTVVSIVTLAVTIAIFFT